MPASTIFEQLHKLFDKPLETYKVGHVSNADTSKGKVVENETPVNGYHAASIQVWDLMRVFIAFGIANPVSGDNLKVNGSK